MKKPIDTLLEKDELIRSFATGTLSESEMERAVALLAEDDTALEALAALWQNDAPWLPAQLTLDEEKSTCLEQKIITRLNRAYFAKSMVTLGTHGFLTAVFGLLRPFRKQ